MGRSKDRRSKARRTDHLWDEPRGAGDPAVDERGALVDKCASEHGAQMMTPDLQELVEAATALQGKFALEDDFTAGAVAAALRTGSGRLFTGICIDLACGIGFCAEHAAAAEMLKHRERHVVALAAVGKRGLLPPCGRCREMLLQVDSRNAGCMVALRGGRVARLADLLPEHWLDADDC